MIVYLAWGSLYWNPEDLPIKNWIPATSLQLPLEFSRISDKGKGRLTLVIDEKNGTYNKIWYSETSLKDVNKAINALKKREHTIKDNIAYTNLKTNRKRVINTPKHVVNLIEDWAQSNNIDTVIWTDLKSNWKDIMHTDYTIERAYQYFTNSELVVRLAILEYIYKAKNLGGIITDFSTYFFKQLNR